MSERFPHPMQELSCDEIKSDESYKGKSYNSRKKIYMDKYNRTNNNFLGASLAVAGKNSDEVVACAPRAKSNSYESTGSVTGACFKKGEGDDSMTHIFDLLNLMSGYQKDDDLREDRKDAENQNWAIFGMMGHSISSMTDEGDLIFGAPIARRTSKQTRSSFLGKFPV